MNILFICLSTLEFNVDTPRNEPLGGTESAIAYLAVELAQIGHTVTLMRSGELDPVISGVKHVPVSEDILPYNADVIILVSAPQAAPAIKKIAPGAKLILWNHMQPDQPAMQHMFHKEVIDAIDEIVYVSARQQESFIKLNPTLLGVKRSNVMENAISPAFEAMFDSSEQILSAKLCRGAYTSTPYRGLSVLSSIKELPIDVYSSMKVYQGDDKEFELMFEQLKTNDCLVLHGSVSQDVLSKELYTKAFLVYPSIFVECHSIAILEAMAAGLKVITTDVAAPQTGYVDSMPASGSLADYVVLLRKNINRFRAHPEQWAEKAFEQVQYINRNFTWSKRAQQWDAFLRNT